MPIIRATFGAVTRRIITGALGCAACAAPAPKSHPGDRAVATWTYEIWVRPGFELEVEAAFDGATTGPLHVDDSAEPFVRDVVLATGAAFRPLDRSDGAWSRACGTHCRVRYRFALGEAASALADVDVALGTDGVVVAPPSTWLLRPGEPARGRFRFHVSSAGNSRFVSGVRPAPGAAPDTYGGDVADLANAAFSAFGALRIRSVVAPGIAVAIAPGVALSDDVIARWIESEVRAISAYLGQLPDDRITIFVLPGRSEVVRGVTLGGGGASVLVRVGTAMTEAKLADDWVVAHELVHVGSPSLSRDHDWFSEGLATYVEPIARARAGLVSPERVWRDMMEGLPQGLPQPGDHGLEGTREWGRIYWGGALYFLLADLEIRRRTNGAQALDTAVRAMRTAGGTVEAYWSLERAIDVGDAATGEHVLHAMYDRLAASSGTEDLEALGARIGVRLEQGGVVFDDGAPLARFRAAITARSVVPH